MSIPLYRTRSQFNKWASTKEGLQVKASILRHQLGLCYHCRCPLSIRETELDHLIPLSLGGPSDTSNLYASCKKCNRGKGSSLPPSKLDWWLLDRIDI